MRGHPNFNWVTLLFIPYTVVLIEPGDIGTTDPKAFSNEANMFVQHYSTLLDATCWPRLNTMLDGNLHASNFWATQCNIVGPKVLHDVGFVWTGSKLVHVFKKKRLSMWLILQLWNFPDMIDTRFRSYGWQTFIRNESAKNLHSISSGYVWVAKRQILRLTLWLLNFGSDLISIA